MLGFIFGLSIPVFIFLIILTFIIIFAIAAHLYTIVPADKADVVIQRGNRKVFSSHPDYSDSGRAAYFKLPRWLPGYGMYVHRMPLEILSIAIPDFLAFDKDRARFLCDIVAYAVIQEPITAAMRFPDTLDDLGKQISKVVQATTRDSTTKRSVREIINDRQGIIEVINDPLREALFHWGLELRDIELVEFKDPTQKEYGEKEPPHVIKDISSIIEVQINSEARQKNAEQIKIARLKEAQAEELAKKREIERDEEVAKREQLKYKLVSEKEKEAVTKRLEVQMVDRVQTQEIERERAKVQAAQEKEVGIINAEQEQEMEKIRKERKRLDGEGERLRLEEIAKGNAAPIRETGQAEAEIIKLKGLAEAEAKEKLQFALNKFGDDAIRALVAEKLVDMQREVGVAGAKALENADLRVFSGGETTHQGFELGSIIEGITTSSSGTAGAVLNRLARPNDLGFKNWGELFGAYMEYSQGQKAQQKDEKKYNSIVKKIDKINNNTTQKTTPKTEQNKKTDNKTKKEK